MYSIFEEEEENAAAQHNQQRGMASFRSIDWKKFKAFNKKYSVSEFLNLSVPTLMSLESDRLEEIQTSYYNMTLDKEARGSLFDVSSSNRDDYVTAESRKRGADNSLQFDRIMKCSRSSASGEVKNKLHGTPYFKAKGCFKEENLDIGERNNWQKVNIPCSTIYNINPLNANLTKWSNTLKQFVGKLPTNCLSVFDHFMNLALKGLTTVGKLRKIWKTVK